MRRKIGFFVLGIVFCAAAFANYGMASSPEMKLTTYYRTHRYDISQIAPDYEIDVASTTIRFVEINTAILFLCLIVATTGGLIFQASKKPSNLINPIKNTVESISTILILSRHQAAIDTIIHLRSKGLIDKAESAASAPRPLRPIDQGINLEEVVTQWAITSCPERESLKATIKLHLVRLTDSQTQSLADAIYTRFMQKFQTCRRAEVVDLLRHSDKPIVSKSAPVIFENIFRFIMQGMNPKEAVWVAVTEFF